MAAQEAGKDEFGHPQIEGLTDSQLQQRYEGRIEQFNCLVEKGALDGEPTSFEVFIEEDRRSGDRSLWSPARDVDMGIAAQMCPSDECPLGGSGW